MNENQDSETCSGAESLQNSTKHDSIQNEISSKDISEDNTPTVLRALHERYGSTCDEQFEFKICVATSAPGMTESGKLILPCVIGLNCLNISAAGDSEELSTLCQKVTELDLSHNNISQLTEVISLLQALQRLHFLNLSYNPLHLSADLTNAQLSHIPYDVPLSKLALNNTRLSWSNLWSLMAKLKNLEELHLSINGIDHVTAPDVDVTYPKLKRIYLYENNISDVEDILMIGHIFPRLQNLVLADNPIKNIDMEADVIKETFPCLEDLNLTSCKLSNWKAFATLQNFPQLKRLRVLRVPLMEKFEKQLCRKLVIAYLPNITHLNGTRVEAAEREDAERAFIRHYMDKEERPTRYEELHRIYGDLDPLVDVDLSPNEKVNVTVTFNDRTELREVELKWTLTKLKNDLEKTFVHHPAKAFRIYHDDRVNQAPEYMRYPTRTLLRYHLKDGDHLIIDLNNKNS